MNEKRFQVSCPACRKKAAWKDNPFRPFCSERCRLVDLGKWASEDYRIAGEKKDLPDGGEQSEKKDDDGG